MGGVSIPKFQEALTGDPRRGIPIIVMTSRVEHVRDPRVPSYK